MTQIRGAFANLVWRSSEKGCRWVRLDSVVHQSLENVRAEDKSRSKQVMPTCRGKVVMVVVRSEC